MLIVTEDKITKICDYCYPLEAIITVEDRDYCLICAAIEGLI